MECLELRDNTIFIEDLSTYDVLADKRDQSDP